MRVWDLSIRSQNGWNLIEIVKSNIVAGSFASKDFLIKSFIRIVDVVFISS